MQCLSVTSTLNKAHLLSSIGAGSTVFVTRDRQAGVKHRIGVNPHCTYWQTNDRGKRGQSNFMFHSTKKKNPTSEPIKCVTAIKILPETQKVSQKHQKLNKNRNTEKINSEHLWMDVQKHLFAVSRARVRSSVQMEAAWPWGVWFPVWNRVLLWLSGNLWLKTWKLSFVLLARQNRLIFWCKNTGILKIVWVFFLLLV